MISSSHPNSVVLWYLNKPGSNGYTLSYFRIDDPPVPSNPTSLPHSPSSFRYLPSDPSKTSKRKVKILRSHTIPNVSTVLNLSRLRLSLFSLPSPATNFLNSLRVLLLQNNSLKFLPESLFSLRGLEELNVGNNLLTSLSPKISQLTSLRELYLHGNSLSKLPQQISLLSNLQVLDVSYNKLQYFPVEIRQLSQLKTFWLSDNLFKSSVPKTLYTDPFSGVPSLFHISLQTVGLKLDSDPHFFCSTPCHGSKLIDGTVSEPSRSNQLKLSSRSDSKVILPTSIINSNSSSRSNFTLSYPLKRISSLDESPKESSRVNQGPSASCFRHPVLRHYLSMLPAPQWRPSCSLCHISLCFPGLKIPAIVTGPTDLTIPVTYVVCGTNCRFKLLRVMDLVRTKSSRSMTL